MDTQKFSEELTLIDDCKAMGIDARGIRRVRELYAARGLEVARRFAETNGMLRPMPVGIASIQIDMGSPARLSPEEMAAGPAFWKELAARHYARGRES